MHGIYELKEILCKELEEYGEKGEMTAGTLDVVDKLAHTVKNLDKILECYEDGEYSGAYADGGSYARGGRGRGANQYGSYARNRRRDSMGRYSRAEDSMQDLLSEMRELMPTVSEDKRREIQRFMDKMQGM